MVANDGLPSSVLRESYGAEVSRKKRGADGKALPSDAGPGPARYDVRGEVGG